MITNSQSGTNVHEIADGIYRINTPVALPGVPGHFNFNQYLIVDEQPMLLHTRPAQAVSGGERGHRGRDAGRAAALCRAVAFRGRRMRCVE